MILGINIRLVWSLTCTKLLLIWLFIICRFYPRWKEYEASHASFLQYSLEEEQWEEDWTSLLSLASRPGTSLEMLHVFALAHILRRPIIVYGVKYVKSFRGEALGYSRFEGQLINVTFEVDSYCKYTPDFHFRRYDFYFHL